MILLSPEDREHERRVWDFFDQCMREGRLTQKDLADVAGSAGLRHRQRSKYKQREHSGETIGE